MKKVIFTLEGKRFEIELEDSFANYVEEQLKESAISFDRNNEIAKLLKAYLTALKNSYDTDKQIEILLNKIVI